MIESSEIVYKPKLSSSQFKKETRVPEGPTAAVTDGALSESDGFVTSGLGVRRQGPVFNLTEADNKPRW